MADISKEVFDEITKQPVTLSYIKEENSNDSKVVVKGSILNLIYALDVLISGIAGARGISYEAVINLLLAGREEEDGEE